MTNSCGTSIEQECFCKPDICSPKRKNNVPISERRRKMTPNPSFQPTAYGGD